MGNLRQDSPIIMNSSYHEPVLVSEVINALNITPGKKYIDGTYGGGGHSRAITGMGGVVLGIDIDPEARAIQGNFKDIEKIAGENGFEKVDGILFDLGVSSHQLDTANRGFSYRFTDAPLDLRLNQESGDTAAQLVNRSSQEQLYEIFASFGEEERSRTIAHAIVRARSIKQIETVGDLASIVGAQNASLSRIFQALRIVINDEFRSLKEGISGASRLLSPGGRLAVISFHSLEDRIVKRKMNEDGWRIISHKPITPSREEVVKNRRSRSAKLRVAEKI